MANKDKLKEIWKKIVTVVCDPKKYRYYGAVIVLIAITLILARCTNGTAADSDPMAGAYGKYQTESKKTNEELVTLMENYYKAYAAGNIKDLKKVAKPISTKEESYIKFFSGYVEKYNDVTVYSKRGLDKESYLVSVSMKIKFKNIKTEAPGLDFFYVKTDKKGTLYIDNIYSNFNTNYSEYEMDTKIVKLIATFEEQDDLKNLQTKVQKEFNAAMVKDEDLNTFLSSTLANATSTWANQYDQEAAKAEEAKKAEAEKKAEEKKQKEADKKAAAKKSEEDKKAAKAKEKQNKKDEKSKKTKYTNKAVSVYNKAGTDGTVLGNLEIGAEVTMYATEGDFARILYNDSHDAYVSKDALVDTKPAGTDVIDVPGLAAGSSITLNTTVRVRGEMDETSQVVAVAYTSEPLTIHENYASGWTKVTTYNNVTGYVKTELIQ